MALFDPNRHYPLPLVNWQPDEVRQAIAAIATETITQLETTPLLSGHPMDDQAFGSDLYFGKAGVLWAIDYLQTVGVIDSTFNVATHLDATLEQNPFSVTPSSVPILSRHPIYLVNCRSCCCSTSYRLPQIKPPRFFRPSTKTISSPSES